MTSSRNTATTTSANRSETIQSGTYTLPETARRLGIGQTTVYDLVRLGRHPFDGTLPVHHIGGQKRTFVAEVERYLEGAA